MHRAVAIQGQGRNIAQTRLIRPDPTSYAMQCNQANLLGRLPNAQKTMVCLLDIFDVPVSGENVTLEFLLVGVP